MMEVWRIALCLISLSSLRSFSITVKVSYYILWCYYFFPFIFHRYIFVNLIGQHVHNNHLKPSCHFIHAYIFKLIIPNPDFLLILFIVKSILFQGNKWKEIPGFIHLYMSVSQKRVCFLLSKLCVRLAQHVRQSCGSYVRPTWSTRSATQHYRNTWRVCGAPWSAWREMCCRSAHATACYNNTSTNCAQHSHTAFPTCHCLVRHTHMVCLFYI